MRAGDQFDVYELVEQIGEGKLGTVWMAKRLDRSQRVSLKLLREDRLTPDQRKEAFERIARALTQVGRLEHPDLQSIYGVPHRAEDGLFAVAAEHLDGGPLQNFGHLSRPEDLGRVIDLVKQLGTVLAWLHERNTVHGNVKPTNILVTPSATGPRIKLLDLCWSNAGLGRPTEEALPYRSPEQRLKRPPTRASDQWSLARLLHLMVVGSGPKPQNDALTHLPVALLRVLKRALSKEPEARYRTMTAFVEALEEASEALAESPHATQSYKRADPTLELSLSSFTDLSALEEESTMDMDEWSPPTDAGENASHPEYSDLVRSETPTVRHESVPPRRAVRHESVPPQRAVRHDSVPPQRAVRRESVPPRRASSRTLPPPEVSEEISEERGDPTSPIALSQLDLSREKESPNPGAIGPKDPTHVVRKSQSEQNESLKNLPSMAVVGIVILVLSIAAGMIAYRWLLSDEPAPTQTSLASTKTIEPAPPETPPSPPPPTEPPPPVPEPPVPPPPTVDTPLPTDPLAEDKRQDPCKKGRRTACLSLGRSYLKTDGANPNQGITLLRKACRLKSIDGCVEAAEQLEGRGQRGDRRNARRLYEKACDMGRGLACARLAKLWRRGSGGAKNERTAEAFDRRACQLGYGSGCP